MTGDQLHDAIRHAMRDARIHNRGQIARFITSDDKPTYSDPAILVNALAARLAPLLPTPTDTVHALATHLRDQADQADTGGHNVELRPDDARALATVFDHTADDTDTLPDDDERAELAAISNHEYGVRWDGDDEIDIRDEKPGDDQDFYHGTVVRRRVGPWEEAPGADRD
jgi:hypothetical protein